MLDLQTFSVIGRLLAATFAGAIIGLERTIHGRAAGFRTHALVCTASALLMQLTIYQLDLLAKTQLGGIRMDPTRMAQGIMTGIGFLGAGVIMREGLTIRGLTTAASIWTTAAIGIIIGMGYYAPAVTAILLVIGVLAIFRWVERIIPSEFFGHLVVVFQSDGDFGEEQLVDFLKNRGFKVANTSYGLRSEGQLLEYQMAVTTRHLKAFGILARELQNLKDIVDFSITPTGH
jgi:putative Mg2+ transporter-C (MgtC) family protein